MRVAIGLGASLGPRRVTLERAVRQLGAGSGLRLRRVSRWYANPPMRGGTARGWFLNGVALYDVADDASPHAILAHCRALEDAAGRRRARFWGDRPLDLDVLVIEGVTSSDPDLTLPHPGIARRAFVYWPLAEVWPEAAAALPGPPPPRRGLVVRGVLARRAGAS